MTPGVENATESLTGKNHGDPKREDCEKVSERMTPIELLAEEH